MSAHVFRHNFGTTEWRELGGSFGVSDASQKQLEFSPSLPYKQEVAGSSPAPPTIILRF